MKNIISIAFVLACLWRITIVLTASEISPQVVLSEDLSKDATLIDVRSVEEFKSGHLKNAINIVHTEIGKEISKHVQKKDAKIVLYCKKGGRAAKALKTLKELGYSKVTNAGGYEDLKDK